MPVVAMVGASVLVDSLSPLSTFLHAVELPAKTPCLCCIGGQSCRHSRNSKSPVGGLVFVIQVKGKCAIFILLIDHALTN